MTNFLLLFFLSFLTFSESINLRSLSDVSSVRIGGISDLPSIFVIFQKDCHACRKQIDDLACLKPIAKVHLVGSFSTEEELRKEFRVFRTSLPGFYGGRVFRKRFKVNQRLTPQILIVGKFKNILLKGLTPCAEIAERVKVKKT